MFGRFLAATLFLVFCFAAAAGRSIGAEYPALNPDHPIRLPVEVDGKLIPRDLGCWFPRLEEATEPDGYKRFLDTMGPRAAFDLFAVSSRMTQIESIAPEAIKFQRDAAVYAWEKYGIRLLPDAEIRLSRKEFNRRFPQRKAEMLVLQEIRQEAGKTLEIAGSRSAMTDHYTHNYPYTVEGARLVKVWSYQKDEGGAILSDTIRDITGEASFREETSESARITHVRLEGDGADAPRFVCAAVAYAYLYPDLYSDEAFDFERELFTAHREIPAGGCVKDEWGFLPCFTGVPNRDEINYSPKGAELYARKNPGRDLTDDALLMFQPQAGKEAERIRVIDAYQQMNFETVLRYEYQLYALTKEFWGPNAFPATHPTWYCSPGANEFRKNSLMWWRHPRDFAQTDEQTPFPCRTGMSKTNGRLWYNEFYADETAPYFAEHWTSLLGGGRVNIHPFCCQPNNPRVTPDNFSGMTTILDEGMERARQRIRMLNLISDAPLYSPAGIVFGHFGVMNWARPEFNSLLGPGLGLCRQFSEKGYPADLIPSSQTGAKNVAQNPCWSVSADGWLQYGNQPYRTVVLFAETDSDRADFDALRRLAASSKTKIVSPDGVSEAIRFLEESDTPKQSPWKERPAMSGFARMTDGTLVWASASLENPAGLPLSIHETVRLSGGQEIKIDAEAVGVLACRFDADGNLTALAGSEIKKFSAAEMTFDLSENAPLPDLALWKDGQGRWKGVFQSEKNALPDGLRPLADDWRYLQILRR